MPKEARRKRRSLPSAIERNLSLEELLGEEKSAKKKERQAKEQQALQLMASVRHNVSFSASMTRFHSHLCTLLLCSTDSTTA